MSTKTNLTVLSLTVIAILGLFTLAGSIVWLGFRLSDKSPSPTVSSNPSTSPPRSTDRPQSLDQVKLESDRGVDYNQLKEALRKQDWRTADRETYQRLLDAAGPKAQSLGFIPPEEMVTLSCQDLTTVDHLWSTASNGKFGFTAQQNILKVLGEYRKMYDQVGWQNVSGQWLIEWNYNPQTKRLDYKPKKEPNFSDPPPGHLPTVERGYNFDSSLDSALKRCQF